MLLYRRIPRDQTCCICVLPHLREKFCSQLKIVRNFFEFSINHVFFFLFISSFSFSLILKKKNPKKTPISDVHQGYRIRDSLICRHFFISLLLILTVILRTWTFSWKSSNKKMKRKKPLAGRLQDFTELGIWSRKWPIAFEC